MLMYVEIVYITQTKECIRTLKISAGTKVEHAIRESGLLESYAEINLKHGKFGIYGKVVPLDTVLRDGDRVEIYQSLLMDPMEARRLRAEQNMDST